LWLKVLYFYLELSKPHGTKTMGKPIKKQDGCSMPEIELKPHLEVSVDAEKSFDWTYRKTDPGTIRICDLAQSILAISDPTDKKYYRFEAHVLNVGQLTRKEWALGSEIHEAILSIGGRFLSAREVFEIRTEYINQPDEELLWVAMNPVNLPGGWENLVLQIERESRWFYLRTYNGNLSRRWHQDCKFIFALDK
jgi:hypothetical protein